MRRTDMEIGGEYVVRGRGLGYIRVRLVSFEAKARAGHGLGGKFEFSPRHVTVEIVEAAGDVTSVRLLDESGMPAPWLTRDMEPGRRFGIATRDILAPWNDGVRWEYEADVARLEAKAKKARAADAAAERLSERMRALGLTGRVVTRGAEVEMTLADVAQIERVLALVEADHGGRENGGAE